MTFDAKSYNRAWMKEYRAKIKQKYLISQGKCPITEILFTSRYHNSDCPCGLHIDTEKMKRDVSLRLKVIDGVYVPIFIKEGIEVSLVHYFHIEEGCYIDIPL